MTPTTKASNQTGRNGAPAGWTSSASCTSPLGVTRSGAGDGLRGTAVDGVAGVLELGLDHAAQGKNDHHDDGRDGRDEQAIFDGGRAFVVLHVATNCHHVGDHGRTLRRRIGADPGSGLRSTARRSPPSVLSVRLPSATRYRTPGRKPRTDGG